MAVYLLHFSKPYKHARHYTGFANDVDARLQAHRKGNGARLVEVITEAGISFTLARVWPEGDRTFERRLKRRKEAPALCPICNPEAHRLANYKEASS